MKVQELRRLLREYESTLFELKLLRDAAALRHVGWDARPQLPAGKLSDIELPVPARIVKDLIASRAAALEDAGRGLATQLGIEFDAAAEPESGEA